MSRPFWALAIVALVLVGASQWVSRTGTWENGATGDDGAIMALGMQSQIDLMREVASDNGWTVDCEGTSGSMTVLRMTPGFLPWKSSNDAVWKELSPVATALSSVPRSAEPAGCDLSSSFYEGNWIEVDEKQIIGVGPRNEMEPMIAIAESCEAKGVRLTDGPPARQDIYAGDIPSDWVGVQIDPRLNPATGPFECLMILTNREFNS
ncbi:hypothetical protein GCM10023208_00500 [Erythrobacter westpacificensis]|uniref:Uncharacterized protein n=2 Tax=Erythrobacter westpacificensis TaxID=1055231 RepID=A0ABP9JWY8_9SPHN